jgi:nucleoside-diphosphate-sugar epimerase
MVGLTLMYVFCSSTDPQAVNTNLLFLKPATHTARILDSGNETFSPSSLSFVARAVLRALERPEATANRYLSVAGLEVTPNQIVAAAEEIQGVKYTVEHVKSTDVLREADEKFARHDYSAFVDVLEAHLYADGAGHAAGEQGERDNEVLGLEREDLKEVLRKVLAK